MFTDQYLAIKEVIQNNHFSIRSWKNSVESKFKGGFVDNKVRALLKVRVALALGETGSDKEEKAYDCFKPFCFVEFS